MPRVQGPLTEGLRVSQDRSGYHGTLRYDVYDLTASSALGKLAEALNAVGINKDDPIPDLPGAFALSKTADPWGDADAVVTIEVGPNESSISSGDNANDYVVSGTASLTTITTEKDKDGKPIKVEWTPQGGRKKEQGGKVTVPVPQPALHFERVEKIAMDAAIAKQKQYSGKRNSSAFHGYEKGELICAVSFQGVDGTAKKRFKMTYDFIADPRDKWVQLAVYIDPQTGVPPVLTDQDIKNQNGVKKVEWHEDADFNQLQL